MSENMFNINVAELKKPIKTPDIMLAKPDRTVIARLKNVVVTNYEINLGKLNKIEFETPAYINKYGEFRFNRYLDKLYEKYLLKVTLNGISEWMVISEIHEIDEQSEKVSVTAFTLAHELTFRTIRNYNVTSYNLTMIMNDLLQDTLWTLGDVDPYFNTIYRSPQLDGTVLDCIFKIADTFEAIIAWDTENRKINFKRPENVGQNRGLKFKLGKYLKSITRDRLADEAFTRIVPYGKDGLQIHRVNPTGQPYIEDFTYYMLPFERDENRNVIQSSRYMSDELCHAILDYNEFVASKEGEFNNLLDQKETLEEQKMNKEAELAQLNEDLKKIEDRLAVQRQTEALTIIDTTYDGWSKTYQTELKKENYYAVMIKVSATENLTIQLDDVVKNVAANTWTVIGKIHDKDITKISLSGSATGVSVKLYIVEIMQGEYDQSGNESTIIETYNEDNKQAQIDAKQTEINALDNQINDIDHAIDNLRNELALENHFTSELLKERQAYVFQTEFVDDNYTSDRELYEAAKNKLAEVAFPKTNITIDIVNLFDVIDPKVQRDWDKLTLGDYVNIEHETLKINYEAQIIGISFNFDNGEIKLTIGSLRNKNDNGSPIDKLKNLYKNAVTSSTIINNNKSKWSKIDAHETAINKILSEPWDATKQAIIAGSNESVLIDNKGIRITDPNNPKELLIANHAVIALTDDGGQTWKHAITTKGIVGERIYGGIFIGANLYMENESGLFRFDKDGAIFDSAAIKLVTSHKGIDFDPGNVIKETPVNTWASNDNISTIPADPVVLPDNQAINHTVNKDGTVNISFEWKYDGDGSNKYDIDGFIVYLYASSSSAKYKFGTDVANEYNFVVSDSKKALILYNLPADLYYTFGVQAYRIVDTSVNKSGILKSAIVKSSIDIENPYCPASRTPYDGDIKGTLTTNDMTQVISKTVQLGFVYNGVQIDTNSGLVVTRSDNNFRSVFNATDGIKLQAKVNGNWEDRFYVDFDGTLRARKLILENENGDIILDGKNGTLDFGKFNAIFGTIKAENIEAKSITADQIKDNSITSDNLHTLAKDLVNNFTKTSDINTGWSIIIGQGTVTAGTSATKNNTPEVILETSSDATYASDYIPIDSSKTYKTTISLYCDDSTGTRYFGVYAYDANKSLIDVTEWNVNSQSWGSTTTTPYFWYGNGVITDADGNPVYRDMEAYILSSNISDNGVPTGRNVDKHFKLPPEARYIRIFVANNNNNGTNTQVNIWSPTVIATDAGINSFNQLVGGQIKLGGANGVSGSLIIANENNENFVEMSSSGVFISKLRVNDIDCDKVLTVENENKTFYVDPINGNDQNDGLTTLTPLKSIQQAFNLTRRSNDGTTQIILIGSNYTFNEFVDMGGYTGKGKIILTFPSDQSVTMYGTLKIVNSGAFIQIENAVISWIQHPNPDLVLTAPLYIERSQGVFVNNCKLFAQNMTQYGAYLSWRSFARFTSCEISGGLQSSIVLEHSDAFVENCTGTSFEGIIVKGTSVLAGTGTAPKGSSGSNVVTTQGGVCNATFTYTDGTSTPPAQPTTTTKQWDNVSSASWRNKYGGWRTDNDYVYQGEFVYNGVSYGVHKGFWFFPADMFTTIQGKTIKRIQFNCTRLAEGGSAGPVNIYFYYHTYQDENTARNVSNPSVYGPVQIFQFAWGDDKWIDLPSEWFSAFSNGTAKGVAIYVNNSSEYAIFDGNATIQITYQ